MTHALRSQRLVALFAGGWLLLNFPLLGLWDSDLTVGGIALFPLALFGIWGGTIALLAWWMETGTPLQDPGPASSMPDPVLDSAAGHEHGAIPLASPVRLTGSGD